MAPYTGENHECQPISVTAEEVPEIIADGTAQETGIVVHNLLAADYERLFGEVYQAGTDQLIPDAQVRIARGGAVSVVLPVGSVIDGAKVDLQIKANPRTEFAGHDKEYYGKIVSIGAPVQLTSVDFAQQYSDAEGFPGQRVQVGLDAAMGLAKGASASTYSIQNVQATGGANWSEVRIDKAGNLTVEIPLGARSGDEARVTVLVEHPDGSRDSVDAVVRVGDGLFAQHNVQYATVETQAGAQAVNPVVERDLLPQDTTFELAGGSQISGWRVTAVDADTGEVSVEAPENGWPGRSIDVPVVVRYSDGSASVALAGFSIAQRQATLHHPGYVPASTDPLVAVTLPQVGDTQLPEESEFRIAPTWTVPDGWSVEVDQVRGDVTVTPPLAAQPGQFIDIPVVVSYPDGSTSRVPAVVTVRGTQHHPMYPATSVAPGRETTIDVQVALPVPPGTRYEIEPGFKVPLGWQAEVEENTGQVRVTAASTAQPGTFIAVPIRISYPNHTRDITPAVVSVADLPTVRYEPAVLAPGGTVELPARGVELQGGATTFHLDTTSNHEGWVISVHENTGTLSVTAPSSARNGEQLSIPVRVSYAGGVEKQAQAFVTVVSDRSAPSYGQKIAEHGQTVQIEPVIPEDLPAGTTFELGVPSAPDGWDISIDPGTGVVTVVVAEDADNGANATIPITVRYPDGTTSEVHSYVTVTATPDPVVTTVRVPSEPVTKAEFIVDRSVQSCHAALASVGLPLLFLAPIGLAQQVGAPAVSDASARLHHALAEFNTGIQQQLGVWDPAQAESASRVATMLADASVHTQHLGAGIAAVAVASVAGLLLWSQCVA